MVCNRGLGVSDLVYNRGLGLLSGILSNVKLPIRRLIPFSDVFSLLYWVF